MTKLFDKVDEGLINDAQDLLGGSDVELMALSLGNNDKHSDNYQMAVSLQLKSALNNLNHNIKKLKKSTNWSSWIMIVLTVMILILTAVLVWKGL
ncbi:hypothetical protein CMI48_04455 [Candidatus Pacearchaeota archaeon]|nr:hypothetical protein [Candidatus Pacearchaeota archaeon]|tara:strand:- start:463 stop:747 length:285 start_codon:yes stop_codon:yes gene_type:complete